MHDTGELNDHRRVESEEGEVVVDEVDHRVSRNDLRPKLTKAASEDDHTKSNVKEDELDPVGHAKHIYLRIEWLTALVNDEDNHEYHELPSHEVPIEVVTLECNGSTLVGDGVTVLVKFWVDGWKTNERCLRTLDHGKPCDGQDLCAKRMEVWTQSQSQVRKLFLCRSKNKRSIR